MAKQNIVTYLTGHDQDIYSLDYSRDGRFLASGSGDRTTKLWEVETGRCFHSLAEEDAVAKDAGVTSVAISPDGKYLASVSSYCEFSLITIPRDHWTE
jgi:glucose repression regulatory protein TUP1